MGCPAPFSISFVGSRTSATSGQLLARTSWPACYWLVGYSISIVSFRMETHVRVGRSGQRSMERVCLCVWAVLGAPNLAIHLATKPTKFVCLQGEKTPHLAHFCLHFDLFTQPRKVFHSIATMRILFTFRNFSILVKLLLNRQVPKTRNRNGNQNQNQDPFQMHKSWTQ